MKTYSFAGRHPGWLSLLVLVGILLVGGGVAYFATDKGKAVLPTLEQPTLNIRSITRERIQAELVAQLRNRAPIRLQIDSLRYETHLDEARLAQGRKARPLVVAPRATSRLSLPLTLNLPELKEKARTAQRDCATVHLRAVLYANLPALGPREIPVDITKRVRIPKLPKIEVADVDVDHLGLKRGAATVRLRITNYEALPLTVKQVNYRFRVEDDLDVRGQETKDVTFDKKGTEIMPIHVRFQPKKLPKVLFKTLFRAKQTTYHLTGSATVAAGPAGARDATLHFQNAGTLKQLKALKNSD